MTKIHHRRRPAVVAGAALVAAAFAVTSAASVSASTTPDGAAAGRAGQLVAAWTGDLNSLDPPFSFVDQNREVTVNVYETLVQYRLEATDDGSLVWQGLDVAPGLAESWEIDGASVTFTLRDDVNFYPSGNPLTADDVVWSFDRAVNVEGGAGRFNFNLAGIFDPAAQVIAVDDRTVRIDFTDADGNPLLNNSSLASLRFPQFSVIDSVAAQAEATEDDPWAAAFLAENVVGTGPYYVAERTPGEQTVLEAVPGYWGDAPAFSPVILRVTGGADVVSLVKGGEAQVAAEGISPRGFDDLAASGFQVINHAVPNILRLDLAVDDGTELENPLVRQAIAYAIPYDQIIEVAFSNRAERATSFVNPKAPGFVPAWEGYVTDLDQARSLLAEAGVEDFTLPLFYDSGVAYSEDVALLLQASLAEIGVTLELVPQPTTQFREQRSARAAGEQSSQSGARLDAAVIWLDDPDPSVDVWVKSTGVANWTHLNDPEIDELHAEFRFSGDADARAAAYATIQELVAESAALVPIALLGRTVAVDPDVTSVAFTNDSHLRFWTLQPVDD
jgi:peptide/nickel transport system substrate-binding protein